MNDRRHVRVWRWLILNALLGTLGGLIAWAIAQTLFTGFYHVSFEAASQIDSWLAYFVFYAFIIISTVLSGGLGGLAGSMLGTVLARRLWHPSRRWFVGWSLTWLLMGAGIRISLVLAYGADPSAFAGSGWWILLGVIISVGFVSFTRPWS